MAVDILVSCSSESVRFAAEYTQGERLIAMLGIAMSISISVCLSNVIPVFHAYILPLETKNTWARDDPAILVLIGACLCGMSKLNIRKALPECFSKSPPSYGVSSTRIVYKATSLLPSR